MRQPTDTIDKDTEHSDRESEGAAPARPPAGSDMRAEERVAIGEAVRTWRTRRARISPGDAADLIRVSPSTWGRMERGMSELSVTEIRALDKAHAGLVKLLFASTFRRLALGVRRQRKNKSKTSARSRFRA